MLLEGTSPAAQPTGKLVRGLIIVARDHPDVLTSLTEHFVGNEDVQVVLDRRQGKRRQRVQVVGQERRGEDRRRPYSPENDLRFRPFRIAGPKPGSPPS